MCLYVRYIIMCTGHNVKLINFMKHALIGGDIDKHHFKIQIFYLPNWATHLKLEFDPFHPSLKIKVIP